MDEHAAEKNIVELVSWLEKVGHGGDAKQTLIDFFRGKTKTCRRAGYNFNRIETEGVLEVCFWLPISEIEKVFKRFDRHKLEEWLPAINIDGIEVLIVTDRKLGECVLVKRLHIIPVDEQGRFISTRTLPDSDVVVLGMLLNLPARRKADTRCDEPSAGA